MYGKRGVFPGGFGLMGSGRGALGLGGIGGGGLSGLAGLGGLGGVRIALNIGGRALGLSDALGSDLIGRYGLLSGGGLDDFTGGLAGNALFNPGAIAGLGGGGQRDFAILGLASGPAIAGERVGGAIGLSRDGRRALSTAASFGALGALGPVGVALGAGLGGLAGAAGSFDFSRVLGLGGRDGIEGALGAIVGASLGAGLTASSPLSSVGATGGATVGGALGGAGGAGVGAATGAALGGAGIGGTIGAGVGGTIAGGPIGAGMGLGIGSFTGI